MQKMTIEFLYLVEIWAEACFCLYTKGWMMGRNVTGIYIIARRYGPVHMIGCQKFAQGSWLMPQIQEDTFRFGGRVRHGSLIGTAHGRRILAHVFLRSSFIAQTTSATILYTPTTRAPAASATTTATTGIESIAHFQNGAKEGLAVCPDLEYLLECRR
jgi:hypothetical protein